jgi:hypothetical protein
MATYEPPSENIFDSLLSDDPSDASSEPSEEEVKLRTIHSEWIDLHVITRSNLLKFENPRVQAARGSNRRTGCKGFGQSCALLVSLTIH